MIPAEFKNTDCEYVGQRVNVHRVELHGEHSPVARDLIVHPGAVVVLPIIEHDGEHDIIMIRNQRYATGTGLWELPAGTLGFATPYESNEAPQLCAARELQEETGYSAGRITPLIDFFTAPGFCTERIFAFLAEELTEGQADLEEAERVTTHRLPLPEVLKMIEGNQVQDAKTIAVLLYYHTFCKNRSA